MDYFAPFFGSAIEKEKGCYLAVALEAEKAIVDLSNEIRGRHNFLPMHMADPPRLKNSFHCTVAFFNEGIDKDTIEILKKEFGEREVRLSLNGYGQAISGDNQALYFSVAGNEIELIRNQIKKLKIPFTSADPHVTFGVHSDTRKDAHGVSKLPQASLPKLEVKGCIQLKQGQKIIF